MDIAQLFHCLICGHLDYLGSTQRYDEFPRPYCALGGGRWMPGSSLTFSPRPDPEKYRLTLLFTLKTSSAFRSFPQKVSVSRTSKIKVDLLVKLGSETFFPRSPFLSLWPLDCYRDPPRLPSYFWCRLTMINHVLFRFLVLNHLL